MGTRKERFLEAFAWTGLTSNGLATKLVMNSRTIYNYTNKNIEPTDTCLRQMAEKFPELSEKWLMTGEGTMFLDKQELEHKTMQKEEEKIENAKSSELIVKLTALYEKLVASMERCSTLEQQLRDANKMIDEMKKNQ